ncbi:MAG: VapC toxin family PIN domain ribonuclease, partial [Rhodothermia bacterium]
NTDSPLHERAYDWLVSLSGTENVVISEFVLAELYRLVRNPVTAKNGVLSPDAAVELIESYRSHPRWLVVGFSHNSRQMHDRMWQRASNPDFAYRKLYDVRTALILIENRVTDFATLNLKDFQDMGFTKVWNPLE